jgi:hypothetical protein
MPDFAWGRQKICAEKHDGQNRFTKIPWRVIILFKHTSLCGGNAFSEAGKNVS